MQIIAGNTVNLPEGVFARVSSYRHHVFVEKLGWELDCHDGLELDQFDRPDTVYVVAQDNEERIQGCARLLPTTQSYLLSEVFPQLLNGAPAPNSPDIWELSRFAAVDLNNPSGTTNRQFSSDLAIKLLRESIKVAKSKGAKRLITVSPLGIERLLSRAGFSMHRAGPPMLIAGKYPIFACWIDLVEG
ncbi:MAG: acyl-homoserine-lactone synthase [Moraxellaceae bacterium]|nr:acyl-homoserine-lactone synthase [Moraxellaceae bacterium]